ncbi:hypothetical protein CPHO_08240 [Corynebacterium phocae]|uniref:Uncharacterized protein n=1 Tax=Corynebacterium phocae TaxID=161895 RepID=A0A1L7D450_9CORY|nr:hypothetical protein [Corynebacterium phocae]APT92875.1 hypothetical protein CPHO_08240 [Corynebacterium phocae]KAA8723197.1 hypothetical protein F4V58_07745 [Corynebacterium phocae]
MDYKNFDTTTDPALVYDRELIEGPIRAALVENFARAAVGFPVRTGAGRRPYHLEVELVGCAYAGGAPCFDYPERPSTGTILARRADGQETQFSADGMSWQDLEDRLHGFMLDWNHDLTALLQEARRCRKKAQEAEQALRAARSGQAAAIRQIRSLGGVTTRDISKLTGVPGRTVDVTLRPKQP